MIKHKSKFEQAVHLGLLVIIFILLFLNFRSNLLVYDAYSSERKNTTVRLNSAALSIGKTVQKEDVDYIGIAREDELKVKYKLSSITVVPSNTIDQIHQADGWLQVETGGKMFAIPASIREALSQSRHRELTRGDEAEYFFSCVVPSSDGRKILVLSTIAPELAYLEDSSRSLIAVNTVAVLIIMALYIVVFRFILAPFRKIRKQALDAGRPVEESTDDVEAMVEDYQKIIGELKEKESQLLLLNQAIQRKADSLQHFNEYLLGSITSGLIMVDTEGKIVSINKAAGTILKVDPPEFTGKHFGSLSIFNGQNAQELKSVLKEDQAKSYRELEVELDADNVLSLGVTISALNDYTAHKVGASILINDLTEINCLRKEVEAKKRLVALGEMAGGLAHQLRNSIGAMRGYNHLVRKRLIKNALDTETIDALDDETREAESLIDRFLSFVRPFDYSPEKYDLVVLFADLLDSFTVRPEYRLIDFKLDTGGRELPPVDVDALLIKQAVGNLVENAAISYGEMPGGVELSLCAQADRVAIQVRDFGCGISPENLDKIFTPFFSTRPSGTGLGLPLARKIVDLHGGSLSVESHVDRGTVFSLTLPLVGPKQPAKHRKNPVATV
ncbi:MAG: ATP-binding protein [Candidatus Zixiibacteriota bacterium]